MRKVEQRDYTAIRTFTRADLGKLEWDVPIVEQATPHSSAGAHKSLGTERLPAR